MSSELPLPPGWKSQVSPNPEHNGAIFYISPTGKSQWTHPALDGGKQQSDAPPSYPNPSSHPHQGGSSNSGGRRHSFSGEDSNRIYDPATGSSAASARNKQKRGLGGKIKDFFAGTEEERARHKAAKAERERIIFERQKELHQLRLQQQQQAHQQRTSFGGYSQGPPGGYGQPGYGQPGYGQPGYGGAGGYGSRRSGFGGGGLGIPLLAGAGGLFLGSQLAGGLGDGGDGGDWGGDGGGGDFGGGGGDFGGGGGDFGGGGGDF